MRKGHINVKIADRETMDSNLYTPIEVQKETTGVQEEIFQIGLGLRKQEIGWCKCEVAFLNHFFAKFNLLVWLVG